MRVSADRADQQNRRNTPTSYGQPTHDPPARRNPDFPRFRHYERHISNPVPRFNKIMDPASGPIATVFPAETGDRKQPANSNARLSAENSNGLRTPTSSAAAGRRSRQRRPFELLFDETDKIESEPNA